MEKNNELNAALSDLYSDLEKLQSARDQVETVTESSKDLTESIARLLKELNEFSIQFGKRNSNKISQLNKSLDDFEIKISSISEKGNDSISEYIEGFKNQTADV